MTRVPIPPGATDPTADADLFVIRRVGLEEALDRIATPLDFESLDVNELTHFECRTSGVSDLALVIPGDILRVTSVIPHWIQSEAPYTDQDFTIAAYENRISGSNPQILAGNRLMLDTYEFGNEDIGRIVWLSGFPSMAYNNPARILSFQGNTATISLTTTTNETGTDWAFKRLRIDPGPAPGQEARYFPTIVRRVKWEVRRGSAVVATGNEGYTERVDFASPLFRDHRFTSLEATQAAAENRFTSTRSLVSSAQLRYSEIDTTFSGLSTYNYPPVT